HRQHQSLAHRRPRVRRRHLLCSERRPRRARLHPDLAGPKSLIAAAASQSAAIWVGSPNYWPGRADWPKVACVLHTESGHETGTDAEFENSASRLSSNASVALDGTVRQFVKWADAAWANGISDADSSYWRLPGVIPGVNPNYQTVSVETEDNAQPDTEPVTPAQYRGTLNRFREAIATNGTERYLLPHHLIYSGHTCLGKRWLETGLFEELAHDPNLLPLKTPADVDALLG